MSNIKLSGHTWDTSGIYDAEQEKTQAQVNSELKTALKFNNANVSNLVYYDHALKTQASINDYTLFKKTTDSTRKIIFIRVKSFNSITNNYPIVYTRYRADDSQIQRTGFSRAKLLKGVSFVCTSETASWRIEYNSGGVASEITDLEIWESEINCVVPTTPKIYHVESDGSGDYTSLVTAIEEAEFYFGSVVYVGTGDWDLIDELGSEYIESVSDSQRGVVLNNGIHLIFSSDSCVLCQYTGETADTIRWLSAFNSGQYGFTIENANIISSNCRYTFHDERGNDADFYVNKYINCHMSHNSSVHFQCIGGGLGLNGYIEIRGCTFTNAYLASIDGAGEIVSYHNNGASSGKSNIYISDCYFVGKTGIRFSYYGTSTSMSKMCVCNTSIGRKATNGILVSAENESATVVNVEVSQWLNEFRLDNT